MASGYTFPQGELIPKCKANMVDEHKSHWVLRETAQVTKGKSRDEAKGKDMGKAEKGKNENKKGDSSKEDQVMGEQQLVARVVSPLSPDQGPWGQQEPRTMSPPRLQVRQEGQQQHADRAQQTLNLVQKFEKLVG